MSQPAAPTTSPLIDLVDRLPGRTVVLIGDLMMDRYLYGNAERLSPEAPVPVLHFQHEEFRLGGAGSVAADLAALGANVRVVGAVGADTTGNDIRTELQKQGADTTGLISIPNRPTTCKTRMVGLAQHRHPQQMMRLDLENSAPFDISVGDEIVAKFAQAIDGAHVVCLEDYNKGLLTEDVTRKVIAVARAKRVPVIVDPAAIRNYSKYFGATAIKLNRTETEKATGLALTNLAEYTAAGEKLLKELGLEAAVITLDKSGAFLATKDGQRSWLRTRQRQVYDVTGAGDMVLAALSLARAAGATWEQATAIANVAGGIEVEKFGSVPVTRAEIIAELLAESRDKIGKVRTLDHLLPELARHRAAGKRIVFTNGCFDLIHLGHVSYFRFAKSQGDILVVGVNTDSSIRRLKGEKRPIISEDDRISVLEELESIDYLVTFDDDTPLALIDAIRPSVLVKGADYSKDKVVGWDVVESYGGSVALAPLVDGRSTSNVIKRILEAYGEAR
jgi:D-beta-D-heptose 7-phosphate kinase/D-beta-D-heptose 1-phosphate adenosyltransferase